MRELQGKIAWHSPHDEATGQRACEEHEDRSPALRRQLVLEMHAREIKIRELNAGDGIKDPNAGGRVQG